MKSVILKSFAKINLTLDVLGKRDDGFHELKTLFHRISLFDTIKLSLAQPGEIIITCNHPDVPCNKRNLVYRVAKMLQEHTNTNLGVAIDINKNIPVAAGLAGGSSNAATVLKGLNRLWNLKLSDRQLIKIGGQIGSDVPFFLYDCPWGLGTGRGEKIKPLKIGAKLHFLVVTPKVKMHTPKVYQALKLRLTNKGDNVNILTHYVRKNKLFKVGQHLQNDLESAILRLKPNLLKSKNRLECLDPLGVCFSGSGPSVFALFQDKSSALKGFAKVKNIYSRAYVVETM